VLVAQSPGEGDDGALGARVVEQVRAANVGVHGGAGNDGIATGHVREGIFREVKERVDIYVESLDPLFPIVCTSLPNTPIQRDPKEKIK
jgi:hypothetical protein